MSKNNPRRQRQADAKKTEHWRAMKIGDRVSLNGYNFRITGLGSNSVMLEVVGEKK